MNWFDVLKNIVNNGTILLYDPRQNNAEQLAGRVSAHIFRLNKVWVPIKVRGVRGIFDSPSIEAHIIAMEKKLGKQLSKEMKEKMLASKDVDDFMEKVAKHRIGFIYIAPVSTWRKDLSKNWYDIGLEQANGYRNMITAAPIPEDYWHYDSSMNNKEIVGVWDGPIKTYTSGIMQDSKMTKELLKLDIEEELREQISNHDVGTPHKLSTLMKEILDKKLDSEW
tara:strand:- start:130 stop:798 length:669 start_codon:yes stop_codon:yes gene_type:complete